MNQKYVLLKDEIEEQLASVNQLKETLKKIGDDLDEEIIRRTQASVLEDFYMASEKIFKLIATEIDKELPSGDKWHKKLLRQMSVRLSQTRPPVIDKELFHQLEEYLRFRHLLHNIYGFQLKYNRFSHPVKKLPETIDQLEKQVLQFLSQLDIIINGNNE